MGWTECWAACSHSWWVTYQSTPSTRHYCPTALFSFEGGARGTSKRLAGWLTSAVQTLFGHRILSILQPYPTTKLFLGFIVHPNHRHGLHDWANSPVRQLCGEIPKFRDWNPYVMCKYRKSPQVSLRVGFQAEFGQINCLQLNQTISLMWKPNFMAAIPNMSLYLILSIWWDYITNKVYCKRFQCLPIKFPAEPLRQPLHLKKSAHEWNQPTITLQVGLQVCPCMCTVYNLSNFTCKYVWVCVCAYTYCTFYIYSVYIYICVCI